MGFLDAVVTSGTPTFTSSGSTSEAMTHDLKQMLDATNSGEGRLAWIAAVDVANAPAMINTAPPGPEGVSELLQLPFAVSPGLESGQLILLDGDRVVGDIQSLGIRVARHAALEMSNTPSPGIRSRLAGEP